MSILSNFSVYAAFARKAVTVAASVAATVGLISTTDAGSLIQGLDGTTGGITAALGGVGLIASVVMSYLAKGKPATPVEVSKVVASAKAAK